MNDTSPTITNCAFTENTADYGGGIYNYQSSPTITNCAFTKNTATKSGGGIYSNDNASPDITNCTFSENSAKWGGGILNGIGISPSITNCTFTENTATKSGGGIYNYKNSTTAITNCIFWANTAPDGPEIYNDDTSNPIITYCDVQGGYMGSRNISTDPLFVDPSNRDFHLQAISPCIDKGNNNAPELPDTDFEGDTRIIDGNNNGTATVDMGVDEYTLPATADGDIAPLGNRDGVVNVGDALIALRFALGLESPTQEDRNHGDVAPLDAQGRPNPDGQITVGDALVLLRKALGIIDF